MSSRVDVRIYLVSEVTGMSSLRNDKDLCGGKGGASLVPFERFPTRRKYSTILIFSRQNSGDELWEVVVCRGVLFKY